MTEKTSGPPPGGTGDEARDDLLPREINPTITKPAATTQAKILRWEHIPATDAARIRQFQARLERRPTRPRYHISAGRSRSQGRS